MASVRSVGWNLGTISEIGGDVADIGRLPHATENGRRFDMTPRASYVIALPIVVALLGGAYSFLATGDFPES